MNSELIDAHDFLRSLSDEQLHACTLDQNYILTACPGSGKTRTIIYRLAYLSSKYSQSYKFNVAITYTNRAADEIRDRIEEMGIDNSSIWCGTIHQFCLEFILRPYMLYSNRLKFGFSIIDEFVKEKYLKNICKSLNGKFGNYRATPEEPRVKADYQNLLETNREIDFDDILSESFKLIRNNPFISKTLASIIRSIQVDEYQDTQEIQYKIISEIFKCNNRILLSFVGDINQAIYSELGGVALTKSQLDNLFETNFNELSLSGCYRSTQQVIDYYRKYQVHSGDIQAVSAIANEESIICHNLGVSVEDLPDAIANIIEFEIKRGIPQNEICVLAPQWHMLFVMTKRLKDALKDVNFDAPMLTPVKYDPLSPFYLITKLLFTRPGRKIKYRKHLAKELMNILSTDFNVSIPETIIPEDFLKIINSTEKQPDGLNMILSAFQNIMSFLKLTLDNYASLLSAYDNFLEKTKERINRFDIDASSNHYYRCFNERSGVVISTLHGIKGEEFSTVIAFGLLQGFVPHWDMIYNKSEYETNTSAKYLIYVMCSRAKLNLFLFSEKGRKTKRGLSYNPTKIILPPTS